MGIKRVSKKLVPALQDADAAILVVNATDPQFATLSVFYSAISNISFFTVLNKCDRIPRPSIRPLITDLMGEVIPTSTKTGRGIAEIKYRLSNWRPNSHILVLGIFNSGKTSLINALTGDMAPVGDIPGTTLEITPHKYGSQTLLDTVGQVIDISKPLMVSIDLAGYDTVESKIRRCLAVDADAITRSVESSLPGLMSAVNAIIDCVGRGGKLVVSGAGASALVAMEIAGQAQETGIPVLCFTNNFSTCQPVSFAKGALEDELAMAEYAGRAVNASDCVLCVSASGGTGFVYRLLELAKEKGAITIAITENSDTPLGHAADIVIKSEGKPEGPSSSPCQTAHLAIGHALMVTVADVRGVDAEQAIRYMLPELCLNKKMGIK